MRYFSFHTSVCVWVFVCSASSVHHAEAAAAAEHESMMMMMMMMTHATLGCGCTHVARGAVRGARCVACELFSACLRLFLVRFFGVVEVFIEKPNNCIVCPFVRVCVCIVCIPCHHYAY